MKNIFKAAILSAAVLAVSLPAVSFAQDATPATQPAAARQADVPVKAVVLFSSGVGYFEHYGSVKGDGSTELRFKTNQINDILKSLILQDLDGGRVNTIQYPSQDPIAKTLSSFQVDISGNPALADLLNQLRGATVTVSASGDTFNGTVLGTESRQIIAQPNTPPVTTWRLNLLSGATIRQIELDKIADVNDMIKDRHPKIGACVDTGHYLRSDTEHQKWHRIQRKMEDFLERVKTCRIESIEKFRRMMDLVQPPQHSEAMTGTVQPIAH